MQDIYAFDIGDFGKLGLLRHILAESNMRLGVLWWRTQLGTSGADGRRTAYLQANGTHSASSLSGKA